MIQPLHSQYYAERLTADSGPIVLPQDCEQPCYDATVIAAGPGRLQDDGTRHAMQAQAGDRIVCLPKDWWEWGTESREVYTAGAMAYCLGEDQEPCWICGKMLGRKEREVDYVVGPPRHHEFECSPRHGKRGFVHDRDLVAVIPGPYHDEIYPANDYVLIEPDQLYFNEQANIVQQRPSGILIASHALVGSEERAKQEGWQRYLESQRLWDSLAWQAEPEYYRHKRLHNWLDGLEPDVRRWARHFAETEEAPHKERWMVQRDVPTRGRVVDLGPQAMDMLGKWDEWGQWHGQLWHEATVHWSDRHTAVVLYVGERQLLALRADLLDAVECE